MKPIEGELFCNNCGKHGHLFYICKIPITSIGVIAFRKVNGIYQYLMIRRKDTLGYIDFMRGKFITSQKQCILNMIIQMTQAEKTILLKKYEQIKAGGVIPLKERIIELIHGVNTEYGFYDLKTLIDESRAIYDWETPEWGFPKGRRNANENDYDCALREFSEETGYHNVPLFNIRNIVPFEETFTGSNYNSYRHKYYLMYVPYDESNKKHKFQKSEVSGMEWFTLEECLQNIRPYNLEKKEVINNVQKCLESIRMISMNKNNRT